MANILSSAAATLAQQLKAHASVSIVYRRGSQSVTLSATLGRQLLRTIDARGNSKIERADRDFIITAADLKLDGSTVATPQRGDQILVSAGTYWQRFDVMPVSSEGAWRACDHADAPTLLRIHAKFVAVVPDPTSSGDAVDDGGGNYLTDGSGNPVTTE